MVPRGHYAAATARRSRRGRRTDRSGCMLLSRGIRDTFDWPLFVMVAAIALIGVVNLYSATNAMPPQLRDIYIQQIYWLTLGAGAAVLIASIDYRYYERYGWVAYGTGIVLLVLVFL